jgi:hypothetical protein
MVALCLDHHKEADVGAFTNDQLREFKRDPFLRRTAKAIAGRFSWRRDQLVVLAGGNWYVNACNRMSFP